MIQFNEEQHLGKKAFIIFLLRGILPTIALVILIIVLIPVHNVILDNLNSSASTTINSTNSVDLINIIISLATILAIFFFILGLIISILRYRTYSFTFKEFDLRMKKGILNLKENSIPYRQIQDVDTERPLTFRLLGLSKVVILSAGHEESSEHENTEIVLEPIDVEIAEEIRTKLEREIGVQVVKNEKEADKEIGI